MSFGVGKDTIFAMTGPDGVGKTTRFNTSRGQLTPNSGDIFLDHNVSLGMAPMESADWAMGL